MGEQISASVDDDDDDESDDDDNIPKSANTLIMLISRILIFSGKCLRHFKKPFSINLYNPEVFFIAWIAPISQQICISSSFLMPLKISSLVSIIINSY
jgi:hypothetical protein